MAGLALTVGVVPAAAAVDTVKLTVVSDGAAPYDTLDSGANNAKVRTNDVLTFGWSYSSDASASASVNFVQTLQAPAAVRFDESNLAQCTAGPGAISPDGQTLTCPVRVDATGSGLVPITVTVPGTLPNGASIASSLTANANALQGGSRSVSVVAAPRLNLRANLFGAATAASPGGVAGRGYSYSFVVTAPADRKGSELVDEPLTFTTDLNALSPNASLIPGSCAPMDRGNYGLPYGRIGVNAGATATNSVADSGTISCRQSGRTVTITISGADLSANSIPTRAATGGTLSVADTYLVSGLFTAFVPDSDTTAAGGTIRSTLQYREFDPTSISGQSNFGTDYEPGGEPSAATCTYTENNNNRSNDNCFSALYGGRSAGYDGSFFSNDVPYTRTINGTVVKAGVAAGEASSGDAGDGVVSAGEKYWTRLQVGSNSGPALTGAAVCDKWDPTLSRTTGGASVYKSGTLATAGTDYTVQYATLPMTTDADRRSTSCAVGTWYDSVKAAGGADVVNAIRFSPKWTITNGHYDFFYVGYEAVDNPTGTIIGHFNSGRLGTDETWGPSYYNKTTNNPTYTGDRLTLSSGRLRVAQTNNLGSGQYAEAGATYTYSLTPTVTTYGASPDKIGNVVLVDTLPSCLAYVSGSASVATQYTAGSNGSDQIPCTGDTGETGPTLRLALGSLTPNSTVAPVTFSVTALRITPDSTTVKNSVTISSDAAVPIDLAKRTVSANAVIRNQTQFALSQITSTPQVETGDDVSYTIAYRNVTGLTVPTVKLVSELPYAGDENDSAVTGRLTFAKIARKPANSSVECTSDRHGTISTDPASTANAWSSTCDASTTALRITVTDVANTTVEALHFTLATSGGATGDRFVSRTNGTFTASGASTKIPTTEKARVDVVASSISGSVWRDRNGDGLHESENGLSGFTVELRGTDSRGAVTKKTVTDTNGAYSFTGLRTGSYQVKFPPAGLGSGTEFSPRAVGDDRSIDSDIDPTSGDSATITLASGVQLTGTDAGVRTAAPKITLATSASALAFGSPVTLTATISPVAATGSVTFTDVTASGPLAGSTLTLGTVAVRDGKAVLTTTLPAFGANIITASYGGDETYPSARSNTSTVESTGTTTALLVSEFRLSGPSGANDQYVELTNSSTFEVPLAGVVVKTAAGTSITLVKTTPTLAPGRSYLIAAAGYSLGQAAAPDLNVATLGNSTGGVKVTVPDTASTVTDAVGATTGYTTGTRLAVLTGTPTVPYAWVRLAQTGSLQNTGDNAADFLLVSTTAASVGGVASAPGSPAPTAFGGPVNVSGKLRSALLAPTVAQAKSPNRDYVVGNPGTLTVRRTLTNTTGAPVTALRVRISSLSEVNGAPQPGAAAAPASPAQLRVVEPATLTSSIPVGSTPQTVYNLTPDTTSGAATALGLNTTLTVPVGADGLAPGASIPVAFTFAVDSGKTFWFSYAVEN